MGGASIYRIVAFVHDRLGADGIDRLWREAGIDPQALGISSDGEDDNVPYAEATAILRAAVEILELPAGARQIGENRGQDLERVTSPAVAVLYELVRSFPSPRAAFEALPLICSRYTPEQTCEVFDAEDDRVSVVLTTQGFGHLPDRRLWCEYTAGMLTVPARVHGYHVEVDEPECEDRGDDRCLYRVRWWATAGDQQAQIEALTQRLALANRQLGMLQEMPADLVSDDPVDVVLARIIDRARHAVAAPAHVLAFRRSDSGDLALHARGTDDERAAAIGADLLDGSQWPPSWLVADIASARRHFGRLVAIRPEGSAAYLDAESRLLNTFAKTAAAALEVATALEQARELALHDQLTGLPNRRLFEDRLDQALSLSRRRGLTGAVVFIDLDGFKAINDRRGHDAGDQVLIQVGQRLSAVLRASDTVARLAGDEFTMLLPEVIDTDALDRVTNRVCGVFDRPFLVGGELLEVGASVGVAKFPGKGDTVRSIVSRADAEMYAMKSALRGTAWWSGENSDAPEPPAA